VHTGLQARSRLQEIDAEFADVTSGDALGALQRERDSATGSETRARLERLIQAVADAVVQSQTRPLNLELREAALGRASPERVSELRERRIAEEGQARARLGYATGLARVQARLPGVELASWRVRAERLLSATQSAFSDQRAFALVRAGRDPGDESGEARSQALGMARFAGLFPAEKLRDCLGFGCESFGADFAAWSWSTATRGATRVFALRVPGEIAIACEPAGGVPSCASLFAAAGQGLAFAHTSPALPVEFRRPLDRAVPAAWAWLLRGRLADPSWLEDFPAGRQAAELAVALAFRSLYALRACAGRLEFDWTLAQLAPESELRRWSSLYAQRMRDATGFEHAPEQYLTGVDSELRALDELRGRCLAEQIAVALRRRFGRKFWRVRRAEALLQELWNTGFSYTAEEIANALDVGPLDVDAIQTGWARPP
jgi:hypothetical protein